MTIQPRAFFAVDRSSSTLAASLLGRIDGRWRFLGGVHLPGPIELDAALGLVAARVAAADPELFAALDIGRQTPVTVSEAVEEWPRLVADPAAPPRIAVVAASERVADALDAAALASGARTLRAEPDPLAIVGSILDSDVEIVLAGAERPPSPAERERLPELAALIAGIAARRPSLKVVLVGGMALHADQVRSTIGERCLVGPALGDGEPAGAAVADFLAQIDPERARLLRASAASIASLATVLERDVEGIELGADFGLRCRYSPFSSGAAPAGHVALRASAALVPHDLEAEIVDGVMAWSPSGLDRNRLRDRLRELRLTPAADAETDAPVLRQALARAALERLDTVTRELDAAPIPDVIVATGEAWEGAPPTVTALAITDVVRRPGAVQVVADHARLLRPFGLIEDDDERARLLADVAEDLLVPLATVLTLQGLRPGREAGRLTVHATSGSSELDLAPGGLELVDLPPGEIARVELELREPANIGAEGRHVAVDIVGGLGGLLVDLRDIPLRLPDRLERRRELLGAWQRAIWPGYDR